MFQHGRSLPRIVSSPSWREPALEHLDGSEEEIVNHRLLSGVLTLALFICGAASSAFAQGLTGQISGVVTDSGGGVLPGATVVVKNVGTNLVRETTTGA